MAISQETADEVIRAVQRRVSLTTFYYILKDLQAIDGGQSYNDSIRMLIDVIKGICEWSNNGTTA